MHFWNDLSSLCQSLLPQSFFDSKIWELRCNSSQAPWPLYHIAWSPQAQVIALLSRLRATKDAAELGKKTACVTWNLSFLNWYRENRVLESKTEPRSESIPRGLQPSHTCVCNYTCSEPHGQGTCLLLSCAQQAWDTGRHPHPSHSAWPAGFSLWPASKTKCYTATRRRVVKSCLPYIYIGVQGIRLQWC